MMIYDAFDGVGQVAFPAIILPCKYCEKLIPEEKMDNHILGNHGRHFNGRIKIKCELCDKLVRSIGMTQHLRMKHGVR